MKIIQKPMWTLLLNILAFGLGYLYLGFTKRFLIFYFMNFFFSYFLFNFAGLHISFLISLLILYTIISFYVYTSCWKLAKNPTLLTAQHPKMKWIYILCILLPNIYLHYVSTEARFQSFQVPSKSMLPTILPGDRFFVDTKQNKIKDFDRGDIIVFKYPKDPEIFYIKRLIGLPGDYIQLKQDRLFINNIEIPTQTLEIKNPLLISSLSETKISSNQFLIEFEKIGSKTYPVLKEKNPAYENSDLNFTLPQGFFFVLGDHRNRSNDSRFWGNVPEELILGKPTYIFLSAEIQNGQFQFRPQRIGQTFFDVY